MKDDPKQIRLEVLAVLGGGIVGKIRGRKPYEAPRLKFLGNARDLTLSPGSRLADGVNPGNKAMRG